MDRNLIIGLAVLAFAVTTMSALVLWSRAIIQRIGRTSARSARAIQYVLKVRKRG